MKKTDIQKIKEKSETELQKDLGLLRDELRNLKFDINSGKLKNFNAVKEVKRKIAVTLTVLNSKK